MVKVIILLKANIFLLALKFYLLKKYLKTPKEEI